MITEVRRRVRIQNAAGLHARPCHALVSAALASPAEVRVKAGGREVNGKSILELMTLNAGFGTELEIVARGEGAEALVAAWTELVESGFHES